MKKSSFDLTLRLSVILLVLTLGSILLKDAVSFFNEKAQIRALKYDFSILISENFSEESWLEEKFIDAYSDKISGDYYVRNSKSYAKEIAQELGDGCAIIYYGKSKISNFEHFAPILFKWQCEFDSKKGLLHSFISNESVYEWKVFLEEKLSARDNDYNLKYQEAFDTIFRRTYAQYSMLSTLTND